MRALWKAVALKVGLFCAFESLAFACPFCGGKGASGLPENLIPAAALWFGARVLMRVMKRCRLRERPAEPESGYPVVSARTAP